MKVNKLLSDQIVANWDAIKYAAVTTNEIKDHIEEYCNDLLVSLLSKKHQCWACISDDNRSLIAIAITHLYNDMGDKFYLFIDTVYVYKATSAMDKDLFVGKLKQFAKQLECDEILFYSNNPSVISSATNIGFIEHKRVFSLRLGGK